ncbi:MAG: Gfo/Idh/MocA family oxidoreductase [Pirellulales bacterium]
MASTDTKDIRVAQIGFRAQGLEHIRAIRQNIVALCDVDERVLHDQRALLRDTYRQPVDTYTDFRRLLERHDIDAVSIATPNHTHALIAIEAARAGKDVYVEKPVSHNIWEGRQLVAAARRFNRVIQSGTQSRSSTAVREAIRFVHSGSLGEIRLVTGTCYKPRMSIGKLEKPLAIPSTIDYELWCGPAAKVELYRPQLHYDWHWDFNTGNGDLGNQGIHQMDVARWFLGESTMAPSVFSVGGRLGYDDAGNTPNTQIVYHGYKKAPLIFEVRGLPRARRFQDKGWSTNMDSYRRSRVGLVVQCERGFVVVANYLAATAYDERGNTIKRWKADATDHHGGWLQAVAARDPKLLTAEIYEGHVSSALCHAGNISLRLGKGAPAAEIADQVAAIDPLANSVDRMMGHLRANEIDIDGRNVLTMGQWLDVDPSDEAFAGNDRANEFRTRDYRKPFVVPSLEQDLKGHSISAL